MTVRMKHRWQSWSTERLLDLRLCDLRLELAGSRLAEPIRRVLTELERRGIRLKPHFWISDEWFSPEGVPGVAVPFYLLHPRLIRLERSQMLEVEGGAAGECMKILRHEVGHAIQHAYRPQRRRRWQQLYGRSSSPYPRFYRPNPASRAFVQHLDGWYAQSHPDEDFAETFAVWLTPRSNWRRHYRGWPAIRKLEYLDEWIGEVGDTPPPVRSKARPDALPRLRKTLREHYERKRELYSVGYSDGYDGDLLRLFSGAPEHRGHQTAASFLRRNGREIRRLVAEWTGEYQFTLDQVLKEFIGRSRELRLRAVGSERQLKLDLAILLTRHTMHYVYRGRYWHPL